MVGATVFTCPFLAICHTHTMVDGLKHYYYYYYNILYVCCVCVCVCCKVKYYGLTCKTNGKQFKRSFCKRKLPLTVIAHFNTRSLNIYCMWTVCTFSFNKQHYNVCCMPMHTSLASLFSQLPSYHMKKIHRNDRARTHTHTQSEMVRATERKTHHSIAYYFINCK